MLDPTSLTGGTNAPDVPRSAFAMPEGSTIRYDRPAAATADFVTGYHLYAAHGPDALGKVDWFLPGTANVRVTLDAGPVAVTIGRRRFDPVPAVALYGPTASALRAETNGGVMIGFGVSALGWARLFDRPAHAHHDRIDPLETLTGPDLPARILEALSDLPGEEAVKPALDALLQPLLDRPHPDEPLIRLLMAALADPAIVKVGEVAERTGLDQAALRRTACRYFGMPTKLLLRRARFLRSFTAMFRSPEAKGYQGIESSYHDASHFLRDAERFLGMTPRRFMALSTPFLDGSVRARGGARQPDAGAPRHRDRARPAGVSIGRLRPRAALPACAIGGIARTCSSAARSVASTSGSPG